jgi:transposase InsO family protein
MKEGNPKSEEPAREAIRRDELAEEVAVARLMILSPLLDTGLLPRQQKKLRRKIATQGWVHPLQGPHKLSERTLRRWQEKFKIDGLDGLRPRFRKDRNSCKAIREEVLEQARLLKQELPQRTVRKVIELLVIRGYAQEGEIKRATLQRHLHKEGLTGRRLKSKDEPVRRYVAEMPGDVWHSDEKYGPYLWLNGKAVRTRIFGFLDDHSRFCPGLEAYLEGIEENMQGCMKRAIRIWGCPKLLYGDNGKVYVSNQLKRLCGELGIGIAHTRPYTPEANGKQERFWGTLSGFITEANAARFTSLEALNDALWAWVELKYNRAAHSALDTGRTPQEVYFANLESIRMVGEEEMSTAFMHQKRRNVHKDGTFSLDGTCWEAGLTWAGQEVEIRYDPKDPEEVWICAEGKRVVKAQPFSPPAWLPARKTNTVKPETRIGETSRAYLDDLTKRAQKDRQPKGLTHFEPEDPDLPMFTAANLLDSLDLSESSLTTQDRRAMYAIFDTFGPIPFEPARRALEQAIVTWGKRRHLTVYFQIIVDARRSGDSHKETT